MGEITPSEAWKNVKDQEIKLYINTRENSMRIAYKNSTLKRDELQFANNPATYSKTTIENIARILALQEINILDQCNVEISPIKVNLTNFNSTELKKKIFILRRTGESKALEDLCTQKVLILMKFNGLEAETYVVKDQDELQAPVFSSTKEFKAFNEYVEIKEYKPLCISLNDVKKIIPKETSIVIDPLTVPVGKKLLTVKIPYDALLQKGNSSVTHH